MKTIQAILAAGLLLAGLGQANATFSGPTIYFGEDQDAGGQVRPGSDAVLARADFLGHLSAAVTEGFESFASGQQALASPLTLALPGTVELSGAGRVLSATHLGRFATSGSNSWEVLGSFSIDFSDPVSAFGFYGTDIGDTGGQITLTLTKTNGGTVDLVVPSTSGGKDASLLFFGFIDNAQSYSRVSFGNTSLAQPDPTKWDYVAFDDITVQSAVPEVSTFWLTGVALLGIIAVRRRAA